VRNAGWVSALDADPRLQTYRSSALSPLDRYCRAAAIAAGTSSSPEGRVVDDGDRGDDRGPADRRSDFRTEYKIVDRLCMITELAPYAEI
jgi:hypothetical protein